MIISKIIGGLGNQMFQYAAARALSLRHGTLLKLDLNGFEGYKLHNGYELKNIFNIDTQVASNLEIKELLGWQGVDWVRSLFNRKSFEKFRKSSFICEPNFEYWSEFDNLNNNVYINGYWQSEKYFDKYSEYILDDFTFRLPLSGENYKMASQISKVESVGLHVRRGDYVSNPKNKFLNVCDIYYYDRAISYLNGLIDAPHFFVFSDDLDWVYDKISLNVEVTYVDINKGVNSHNDMRLMSLCKHNIIANSTFSWWAAWLNLNKGKKVIAPAVWFASELNANDLIPHNWIKL